jgi:polysaccharide biosynthesis PFTS motif protein
MGRFGFRKVPILGPRIWKRYLRPSLILGRAARTLVRSKDPFRNIELCSLLEKTDLNLPSNAFARLGSLATAARACLRQRLIAVTVYPYLLRELMCAVANPDVSIPITAPPAWRHVLVSRGVHVRSNSGIRWAVFLGFFWIQGMYAALLRAWGVLTNRISQAAREPYAVLMNLTPNMLPRQTVGFDFVSWYLETTARPQIGEVWAHMTAHISQPCVTPVVKVTRHYLPGLRGYRRTLQFLCALVWMLLVGTLRGLTGQWWEVVMLEQFVDLLYVRHLPTSDLARAYVFNNAWFIVRPMWTYPAEEAGSKIDLVFYGTNIELFDPGHTPAPVFPGYAGMTWQHYFVWDEVQAEFLKHLGIKAAMTIVGPTGFADNAAVVEDFRKPYVVVFDVTPQRTPSLANRGTPQPYYNDEVWSQFMNQVQTCLATNNFVLVFKKKREIGRRATAFSRRTVEQWSTRDDVIAVDPDVAPQRLIRDAAGVISMPFTSTALIARSMGKPTIFYDPLGALVNERRLAHGIEIAGNRADLERWLAKLPKQHMVSQPVS